MGSHRYSGYLADDESFRGPQMRNLNASHGKDNYNWRNLLRPPSRCGFRNRDASFIPPPRGFTHGHERKPKRHERYLGESSLASDEFSDFMNFLADEDVLDSLQSIVEDAVRRLRDVTTEDGQHLFDIAEDTCSSPASESHSLFYSHRHTDSSSTYSHSKYYTSTASATTTATSSSEEDWQRRFQTKEKQRPAGKVCLLDKFLSRLPKPEKKKKASGGFHAETISEQSGDTYYFLQEHFHIWAKLAESFHQLPQKDYFSKFKKLPKKELSAESLHKEITNVLKRPSPGSLPLYYTGEEPFLTLDFLEENGMLAALQDIINQAVQKVLEATLGDGAPLFDLFGNKGQLLGPCESSMGGSDEEEEEREEEGEGEGEEKDEDEGSGSGGETSEGDSKSDGGGTPGQKKKKRKGKRKKKTVSDAAAEEGKGKPKYTPPPLPKSRRKSVPAEEPLRKPKYVPPPLPKTKPRPPPEEPPPKPKYTPPPLPKPKKKQELVQTDHEAQQSKKAVARHLITTKDIKRAHLQARPLPKQAIIDFLVENAAKLIVYKYNYETLLSSKLGFISVPVTKVLLEIMFGYKRIKGSGIRLCSQIDWTKVNEEIDTPRPRKPKPPKLKAGDKKKAERQKKPEKKKQPADAKKTVVFKPETPTGKVVVTAKPSEKKVVKVRKMKGKTSSSEEGGGKSTEIFEILPPQFPQEPPLKGGSEDEAVEPPTKEPSKRSVTIADESPKRSVISQKSFLSKDSSAKLPSVTPQSEGSPLTPRQSTLSQRLDSEAPKSKRGSTTSFLPPIEPTNQPSIETLKKMSSTLKASINGETSRKSSTILPQT